MANNELFLEVTKAITSMMRDMEEYCREEGDRLEEKLTKLHKKDIEALNKDHKALEDKIAELEKAKKSMERLAYIATGASLVAFGKAAMEWIKLLL